MTTHIHIHKTTDALAPKSTEPLETMRARLATHNEVNSLLRICERYDAEMVGGEIPAHMSNSYYAAQAANAASLAQACTRLAAALQKLARFY